MKSEIIIQLHKNFEDYAHEIDGEEFWFARDLMGLLGYTKWENFAKVIDKAKQSCHTSGHYIADHFPDVRKTIPMPKGAEKEIDDVMLTRYACYLIAQNGDPRKVEIAFAQTYFAVQTRRIELIEQRLADQERLTARQKLSLSEKELSGLILKCKMRDSDRLIAADFDRNVQRLRLWRGRKMSSINYGGHRV
ncbi:MAG: hypothetical protein EPN22_12385 [Nitrospirae bacterium]|nr:MAG: hypothetical protein EPN22_12385 [Nitrospirota bacterium]